MSSHPVDAASITARTAPVWGWTPRVDVAACSACGLCLMVCPAGAVGIAFAEDRPWVPTIDGARCVRCFDCEVACPDGAIELPFEIVEEEFALS